MQEWISVKDRMPDEKPFGFNCHSSDYVLVYTAISKSIVSGCDLDCFVDHTYDGEWQLCKNVTHWMPLPDAPDKE